MQRGRYLRKCPDCGGFFPWQAWHVCCTSDVHIPSQSWGQFLSATATPGNGGPLMQPRGQRGVLYEVPEAPSEEERAAVQEEEARINARLSERELQQERDGASEKNK